MSTDRYHITTERLDCRDFSSLSQAEVQTVAQALPAMLTPAVVSALPAEFQQIDCNIKAGRLLQSLAISCQLWLLFSKDTNGCIGLCFLHPAIQQQGQVLQWHLGYLFAESHWGQGLATELLVAVVGHIKARHQHGVVLAGVEQGNHASIKVLQKVGFKLDAARSKAALFYRYVW